MPGEVVFLFGAAQLTMMLKSGLSALWIVVAVDRCCVCCPRSGWTLPAIFLAGRTWKSLSARDERPAIFVFLIREDEMMVATTTIVTGSKHSIGVARDGFGLRC